MLIQKEVTMSRIRVDLKGAVAKFPHKLRGGGIHGAGRKMKNCAGKDGCPADRMLPATASPCFAPGIVATCEVDWLFFLNGLGRRSKECFFIQPKKSL